MGNDIRDSTSTNEEHSSLKLDKTEWIICKLDVTPLNSPEAACPLAGDLLLARPDEPRAWLATVFTPGLLSGSCGPWDLSTARAPVDPPRPRPRPLSMPRTWKYKDYNEASSYMGSVPCQQ